jgi:hypothetical protein
MSVSGMQFALVSLFLSLAAWGVYWRLIFKMQVPRKPRGFQFVMAASLALAIAALFSRPGWAGASAAVIALLASSMFLFTSVMSAMPRAVPVVSVGERILSFSASDADGVTFESAVLDGRPYLLKFFRGHW